MQQITLLGSTGSIGRSTLDVIARNSNRFQVFALTAHNNVSLLAQQCLEFTPKFAVLSDPQKAAELRDTLAGKTCETEVLCGMAAFEEVASDSQVDTVVAAIVGSVGLKPTMAAVKSGKKVLLANKESLVMAGKAFMDAVANHKATLLPLDSEHNAIFQCLPYKGFQDSLGAAKPDALKDSGIAKILLTGSGGPFRETPIADLIAVTPDQACAHPNWSMGRKISVDSATMMNKGLEFIEARWLFDVSPDDIEVVIHPQSVIHSMAQYIDGSVLAQMGNPDMRTPIAHALAWPERVESGVAHLDFFEVARLDFSRPDFERFPCLRLAIDASRESSTIAAVMNAANEVAVEAFLDEKIRYTDIATIVESVMNRCDSPTTTDLEAIVSIDQQARIIAQEEIRSKQR